MAKKDSRNKTSGKKATGESKVERTVAKQSDEIKSLASTTKELRKENERLAKRFQKLEKDDRLAKRLKTLERDHSKSVKKLDSLSDELERTKSAAASAGKKKSSKGGKSGGKPKRPGEESEPIITNAAEKKAIETGVDLSGVKGTGAEGRITAKDVQKKADESAKAKSAGKKARSKKAKATAKK